MLYFGIFLYHIQNQLYTIHRLVKLPTKLTRSFSAESLRNIQLVIDVFIKTKQRTKAFVYTVNDSTFPLIDFTVSSFALTTPV